MQHTHIHPEQWCDIPDWIGYYEVSSRGSARSKSRTITMRNGVKRRYQAHPLKPLKHRSGHLFVHLQRGGTRKVRFIHQLVLEAFVGPRPEGAVTCHNNGDPADNRIENLRWDTPASNAQDTIEHGRHSKLRMTHCSYGHELSEVNLVGWHARQGHRKCKACQKAQGHIRYRKLPMHLHQMISDQYYADVLHGRYERGEDECPQGHPMEGSNLVRSNWEKRGIRQCRACASTHSYLCRRPELKGNFKEIADSYYQSYTT